jgi:hypothetical protein
MSDNEPDPDPAADPEAAFLTSLWDSLETAVEMAIAKDVLDHLDDVLLHCEAAAAAIRAWQSKSG